MRIMLHGSPGASAGHAQAHGHAEGRKIPFAEPGSKTRPLLISSGKGGVGKSSVTTNLAVALAAQGYSVGVVDADIYGYSIPRMLGADRDPVVIDQMLLPPESKYGVRCISIGYFVPEGQAVIWRGPMLHKALEQFLTDVYWDEPDFLLVDMPPGTGDIALSLSQYLPRGEVYVVTTPQPAAQKVARLSAAMADKVNLPGEGHHREHELVHRRRRQALRDLRQRRRRRTGRRTRRAAARSAAPGAGAPRGRRRRPADHRGRPHQ